MRIFFILLAFFLMNVNLISQEGFSEVYDLDGIGSTFKNILLVEDTLVLIASNREDATTPWGISLIKMDTLGNILDITMHTDPLGDHLAFNSNTGFSKTPDGGYVTTPRLFNRSNEALMKFNRNGNLDFLKEYDSENHVSLIKTVPLEDGFLLGGYTLIPNEGYDILIRKTDLLGEVLWEKEYDFYTQNNFLGSFIKVDDNTFVIGGSVSGNAWTRSIIFAIDSLGEVKWDKRSPLNEESSVVGLHKTTDNGWVYGTNTRYDQGGFGNIQKIVKRDADFNLVWSQRLDAFNFLAVDKVRDVKPTPDGGWVACGSYLWPNPFPYELDPFEPEPIDTIYTWLNGFLHKVSSEGDSLWSRRDTVFWSDTYASENYLKGLVVLPSGSIIAAGYSNVSDGTPRSWAWLIKVDKNGCKDTLCTLTGIKNLFVNKKGINIYPNPFYEEINIDIEGVYTIEIYDTDGRFIKREKDLRNLSSIKFNGITAGSYFLKIHLKDGTVVKKVLKIE